MHLITLNIWGGFIRDSLLDFIKSHQEIDIFCLQEVYHNAPHQMSDDGKAVSLDIFERIQELLPNHVGYFKPVLWDAYGIAVFIKKNITVIDTGHISVFENETYRGRGPTHNRILQWLLCKKDGKTFTIMNVHGLWNGLGKTDSDDRLEQSRRIKQFMDTVKTPKILCGDFNLRPETTSISILKEGMNDLIGKHGITSARTQLYDKPEKYADYIFTSPKINVIDFKVWRDVVSDHNPLYLNFSINQKIS